MLKQGKQQLRPHQSAVKQVSHIACTFWQLQESQQAAAYVRATQTYDSTSDTVRGMAGGASYPPAGFQVWTRCVAHPGTPVLSGHHP
jgi:hypothetical protein